MPDADDSASARAAARRAKPGQWPVRRYALGDEPVLDPLDTSTAAERLEQLAELSERRGR